MGLFCDNLMFMKTVQSGEKEKSDLVYEVGCLFVPLISDKDILGEVAKIKSILEKLGLVFLSGDGPKMKELTYPMKKIVAGEKHLFEEAYFVWLKFLAEADKLADLKKDLDKIDTLIRYLLIKTVKEDTFVSNPKKVMLENLENKKIIKPAKVVKSEEPLLVDSSEEVEEEERDLDETIDKLVIK